MAQQDNLSPSDRDPTWSRGRKMEKLPGSYVNLLLNVVGGQLRSSLSHWEWNQQPSDP